MIRIELSMNAEFLSLREGGVWEGLPVSVFRKETELYGLLIKADIRE